MTLQERLIELSGYGISFNVANGNFVVRIRYNSEWDVIKPENSEIGFYRDDNDDNIYYYVAPVSMDIETLFSAIDETILYNRELEEKVVLFKEKMNELQKIFAKEPIDVLKTLEFKVKKKKEKVKKEKMIVDELCEDDIKNEEQKIEEKEETNTSLSEIDAKIDAVLNE